MAKKIKAKMNLKQKFDKAYVEMKDKSAKERFARAEGKGECTCGK